MDGEADGCRRVGSDHGGTSGVRELTSGDLGLLLSVFVLLLIAFGVDFHISRKQAERHHARALVFTLTSLIGEATTAIALILTWVALWSPAAWERIDNLLVFVPGSIAILCAVTLTIETVVGRLAGLVRSRAGDRPTSPPEQRLHQ
jgi:hypothetical protein